MTPRFAPLCLVEEHFRALQILARNRGYSDRYADGMARIRDIIHDYMAAEMLSN